MATCANGASSRCVRDSRVTMIYEGTNEIQAIDLLVRKVLADGGAGMSGLLVELRDELDASRDIDADVQRRLAQLRYLTTTHRDGRARPTPALPYEVADDYLRVVMLALLAWAWARIGTLPRRRRPLVGARRRPSAAGCCRSSRCGSASSSGPARPSPRRRRRPDAHDADRQDSYACTMAVSRKKSPSATHSPAPRSDRLDTRVLETFVGYNARRAWLVVSQVFAERMAAYGLKQVDFSVLSLLAHNPGATSRQLCSTLDILPPNLVSLIAGDGQPRPDRAPAASARRPRHRPAT